MNMRPETSAQKDTHPLTLLLHSCAQTLVAGRMLHKRIVRTAFVASIAVALPYALHMMT